jgi:hypothetical protein
MIEWTADLDGTPVAIASIRSQRRAGASSWLTLQIPAWSQALQDLAEGATTASVYADAELFLAATITEVTPNRAPYRGSVTVRARIIPTAFTAQTRAVFGVTERGDDAGRRSLVCDPDPDMRPNDTVDDGETQWLAGIIDYSIGVNEQAMRIVEAL